MRYITCARRIMQGNGYIANRVKAFLHRPCNKAEVSQSVYQDITAYANNIRVSHYRFSIIASDTTDMLVARVRSISRCNSLEDDLITNFLPPESTSPGNDPFIPMQSIAIHVHICIYIYIYTYVILYILLIYFLIIFKGSIMCCVTCARQRNRHIANRVKALLQ